MKKLIKICIVSFIAIILTGCGKNYNKLSFSDYNSYFESKEGYTINDKTSFYDSSIIRYYEAGNGNVQVFFIEYADSKDAKKYVEDLYENDKKYKIKNNDEDMESSTDLDLNNDNSNVRIEDLEDEMLDFTPKYNNEQNTNKED